MMTLTSSGIIMRNETLEQVMQSIRHSGDYVIS